MLSAWALLSVFISGASAHSFSTGLGTIESIQAGHYHFHLPVEFNLQGDLGVHFGAEDEEAHAEHSGASMTLVFAGDYDRIRREVIRAKIELPPESWQVPVAAAEAPRSKLRVRKFGIGLGPDAHLGAIALGLLPGRESSFFHRIPCATSACEESFNRRFPKELSEWIARPVGERMSYAKATGLHITLMGGVHGVVSGGPAFSRERVWNVALEKTEDGKVAVTASEDALLSYGFELENSVVALMPGKQSMKSHGFEFTLDPFSESGAEAYRNILAGRLDRVTADRTSRTGAKARAFISSLGIPVLTGVGVESNRNTVTLESGDEKLHLTLRQDALRARGTVSRHLLRGRYLIASVDEHALHDESEHAAEGDEEESGISFTSLWIFERDRLSPERLGRWLKRLARKAGLPELEMVKLAHEKPDYLRAEQRILFPKELIHEWLEFDGYDSHARKYVELPEELTKTPRWSRILRRTRRALAEKNGRELSQAIEQAGVEWTNHFPAIRKRAVAEGRSLPVVFELRLSGESIPETVKAWKLDTSVPAR
jgi:hypothetical protein